MKILAWLILIWLCWLIIGSVFGALGKLIWLAILGSIAVAVWNYIKSS